MVALDQMKAEIMGYEQTMHEVEASLDIVNKEKKIEELEREMEAPDFWNEPDKANAKMKELKNMKDTIDLAKKLNTQYDDILTLIELGDESDDESMVDEVRSELDEFIEELEELRISTLLSEEYDKCNAILELNAGAGGTESCDWCSMLYRMYTRWAERHGFTVEVLDMLDGDEAGIKS
ncbi:MAG: PCRF domain-containing protein, partial [Lachnospiraceae bacterium]|nr:PCRF domain-containing protein [Lachnospiraceae bacterium]